MEKEINNDKNEIEVKNSVLENRTELFDKNQKKLKNFSKKLPDRVNLPTVATNSGLFNMFKYKVTGQDLNNLTEVIQDKMISQNKIIVRTVKEFNTIYETFAALDKEYIQGILISIKAAEKANDRAIEGIKKIELNQQDIKKIINEQKTVLKVLQKFKDDIDKIESLENIDCIANDLNEVKEKFESEIDSLNKETVKREELKLELGNINKLSNDNKTKIINVGKDLSSTKESLTNDLKEVKEKFESEIDSLNKESVKREEELKLELGNINKLSNDNKTKIINVDKDLSSTKESLTNDLKEVKEKFESEIDSLNKAVEINDIKIEELENIIFNLKQRYKIIYIFVFIILIFIVFLLIRNGVS